MAGLCEPSVRVVEAAPGRGQDRACARRTTDGYLLVLADGAGGSTRGAEAADRIVEAVLVASLGSPRACTDLLRALDPGLPGETTAVVLRVVGEQVFGAIVGDSEAFVLRGTDLVDLAPNRRPKPLLGSGRATITTIDGRLVGPLVAGSDGLFKYVQCARISAIVSRLGSAGFDAGAACDALVEAARLPSGALADDLAVIVADVER